MCGFEQIATHRHAHRTARGRENHRPSLRRNSSSPMTGTPRLSAFARLLPAAFAGDDEAGLFATRCPAALPPALSDGLFGLGAAEALERAGDDDGHALERASRGANLGRRGLDARGQQRVHEPRRWRDRQRSRGWSRRRSRPRRRWPASSSRGSAAQRVHRAEALGQIARRLAPTLGMPMAKMNASERASLAGARGRRSRFCAFFSPKRGSPASCSAVSAIELVGLAAPAPRRPAAPAVFSEKVSMSMASRPAKCDKAHDDLRPAAVAVRAEQVRAALHRAAPRRPGRRRAFRRRARPARTRPRGP